MSEIQQLRESIKALFDQLTYDEQKEIITLIESKRIHSQGEA